MSTAARGSASARPERTLRARRQRVRTVRRERSAVLSTTSPLTTALAAGDRVRARFPGAREDRYVCVGISDEGEGIDEETRARIFEPFVTTKQAQDGSGLGLAVVYGVVNAHTGFIDVTSEKGKGASFSIYLPVGSLAEESPEPEKEEADRPAEMMGAIRRALQVPTAR